MTFHFIFRELETSNLNLYISATHQLAQKYEGEEVENISSSTVTGLVIICVCNLALIQV